MNTFKGSQGYILNLVSSPAFFTQINKLLLPLGAEVKANDNYFPKSFTDHKEAELGDFLKHNFRDELGPKIVNWWLAVKGTNSRTPNWDLISTCTINNKKGILLVEAKAHVHELENESKGKPLKKDATPNSKKNHEKIKKAIEEARQGIIKHGNEVAISRDNCYQLSNRVAHAWWLANNNIPVVLLYLGFLDVQDMNNGKNILLNSNQHWQSTFINHANKVGVDQIINKWIDCGESSFITICESI
jgi:hypothetical protein